MARVRSFEERGRRGLEREDGQGFEKGTDRKESVRKEGEETKE